MKKILNWKKVLEQDLDYVCEELKEILSSKSCIILTGEVGAGKTTLTQHFMKNQIEDDILSPTYSLIHESGVYAHADFYRIEDPEEIIHLEMSLYSEGKEYFLIEWGIEYLKEIKSQLGDQFKFYELKVNINSSEEKAEHSRDIDLYEL